MLITTFFILVSSLNVTINENQLTGDTYANIITQNNINVSTILSIKVIEGDFPLESISSEYSQLQSIEIPKKFFTDKINNEQFKDMTSLITVIINGATEIGTSSFEGCTKLQTIQFNSCTIINSNSFKSCSSLTSITMPNLTTIGSYCFQGTAITTVKFDQLTSMSEDGYCFYFCTSLETVELNSIETLTQNAFEGCTSLHTITGAKITQIKNNCFNLCLKLKTFNLNSLERIGNNVFENLNSIIEVNFSNVKRIDSNAYKNCEQLTTVILNSCTEIRNEAFSGCLSLNRIEIPELQILGCLAFQSTGLIDIDLPKLNKLDLCTYDRTSDYGGHFMKCELLKTFKANLAPKISSYMFNGCNQLSSLSMNNSMNIGNNAFNDCESLSQLTLPKVTMIPSDFFRNHDYLKSVKFDSVISVSSGGFYSCLNLEKVEFESCIKVSSSAFQNCIQLKIIHFPKLTEIDRSAFEKTGLNEIELNSVTTLARYGSADGNHFKDCQNLKKVTMNGLSTIEIGSFQNCVLLNSINFPNANVICDKAFVGCNSLSNINFPSVTEIRKSAFETLGQIKELNLPTLQTVGESSFSGCSNLEAVYLENCNKISTRAFYNCIMLKNISLPKLIEIDQSAFENTGLIEIELNSVTKLNRNSTDDGNHFKGCLNLKKVTMNGLSTIEICSFKNCEKLESIEFLNVKVICEYAFFGCNSLSNISFLLVTEIRESAFESLGQIKELNLPTLQTVGESSFSGCSNLETVYLENCNKISTKAFCNCSMLKNISLPKLIEIGQSAFENTGLIEIELNSVTKLNRIGNDDGNHFKGCLNLKKVTMNSLSIIQTCSFQQCSQLTEITCPSCTEICDRCFDGCLSLTTVNLESCQIIGENSFNGCNSIKFLSLGFDTVKFDKIQNKQNLITVYFPKALNVPKESFLNFSEMTTCRLPSVTTIESSAFKNCIKLTELEIPNVSTLVGDDIFNGCSSLSSLLFRSLVSVDPTSANIFTGCNGLEYITLPDKPPQVFHKDTFKNLSSNCKVFIPPSSFSIYDNDTSIEGDQAGDNHWCGIELINNDYITITADGKDGGGANLFDACISTGIPMNEIENLQIKTGQIKQEEMTQFKEKFTNLNELIIDETASIMNEIIPIRFLKNHLEIKSVLIYCPITIIEESAFESCSKLEEISCKTAKEIRSSCFNGPTLLKSLSFDQLETLNGSDFFSNNPLLDTISLPKLTSIKSELISKNSSLLKSINLPEKPPNITGKFLIEDAQPNLIGISNDAAIEYDKEDGKEDMKYYSLNLTYYLISCKIDGKRVNGITLKSIVPDDAKIIDVFEGKINDTDFPLPSSITSFSVKEKVTIESIPTNAMSNLINLKSLIIFSNNEFVINDSAFLGCSSLETVTIVGSTLIKGFAFKNCTKLKTVVLNNVKTIEGNNHFDECFELESVSFQSLEKVPKDSSFIFRGCTKLSIIKLPSTPPQTFNSITFDEQKDQLLLVVPNETDYINYDNDKSIEGDEEKDGLWCGIILPYNYIIIKVNQQSKIINGRNLSDCISSSGIQTDLITSLEITRGIITVTSLKETINSLLFLDTLIVFPSVKIQEEFTDSAFANSKLVTINLPSIQTIPSNCFKNCMNLKNVYLNGATEISDSAFINCSSLEDISLNVVNFTGDSHFKGCTSLKSISLTKLVNVNSSSENIFNGCPLTSIFLPQKPPETFNKNVFNGMKVLICGLTNEDLKNYDSNTKVDDDKKNDYKWCGIELVQLYINVSINNEQPINVSTLTDLFNSDDEMKKIESIEIHQGMIKKSNLDELKKFTSLKSFSITENAVLESPIIDSEQFKGLTTLTNVSIMQNVSLMSNCFNGCTSLESIEFKEVKVICEGCFQGCTSLNKITIPNCKELRGDSIFSCCTSLSQIDLSSIEKVDNDASQIFKNCTQLKSIYLPSKEPTTFHKDTFSSCTEIKLYLPNKDDYLLYDDESHVADDKKIDGEWCGINITEFLPEILIFKIKGKEYKSRKLSSVIKKLTSNIETLSLESYSFNLLSDDETNEDNSPLNIETLVLISGSFDSYDLKEAISGCSTLTSFIAQNGTLTEIVTGTFDGCTSLKEIDIYPDIIIGLNALQNIKSLNVLKLRMVQSIRSSEFDGDVNLTDVSLPMLTILPNELFANMNELKIVELNSTSMLMDGCFKNCTSLENLVLPSVKVLNGDSQFENCENLTTIDLHSLTTVDKNSEFIFKGCKNLSEIKLGMEPPITFHENIFINLGKENLSSLIVTLPNESAWENYIPQSSLNESNNNYKWYGIDTGLKGNSEESSSLSDSECSCPEISESISCPEPTECSCPESTECSCPEISESISCPEPTECSCPESTECSCPEISESISCPESTECSCPEISESISCPEPTECSCPEISESISCPEPTECSCPEPAECSSCPEPVECSSCPETIECSSCPELPENTNSPEQIVNTNCSEQEIRERTVSKPNNTAAIIVGVVLGVIIIGLVCALVIYMYKHRRIKIGDDAMIL